MRYVCMFAKYISSKQKTSAVHHWELLNIDFIIFIRYYCCSNVWILKYLHLSPQDKLCREYFGKTEWTLLRRDTNEVK